MRRASSSCAARIQDVGDLAHRDGARADVAQLLVHRQLSSRRMRSASSSWPRCNTMSAILPMVPAIERTSPRSVKIASQLSASSICPLPERRSAQSAHSMAWRLGSSSSRVQSLREEGFLLAHLADAPRCLGSQPEQADACRQASRPVRGDAFLGGREGAPGVVLRTENRQAASRCRTGEDLQGIAGEAGDAEEF